MTRIASYWKFLTFHILCVAFAMLYLIFKASKFQPCRVTFLAGRIIHNLMLIGTGVSVNSAWGNFWKFPNSYKQEFLKFDYPNKFQRYNPLDFWVEWSRLLVSEPLRIMTLTAQFFSILFLGVNSAGMEKIDLTFVISHMAPSHALDIEEYLRILIFGKKYLRILSQGSCCQVKWSLNFPK